MDSTDLTGSATALGEAIKRTDTSLSASGLVQDPVRLRAAQLADDILVQSVQVEGARDDTIAAWQAEEESTSTRLVLQIPGSSSGATATRELITATKAFYFFVRAYQDATYAVLFELLTERAAGAARMQRAAERPENPVGRLLRQRLPDYLSWFQGWRTERNLMKDGVGFSVVGPSADVGILVTTFLNGGGVLVDLTEAPIRMSDLVNAIEASTSLTALVAQLADEQSRP